MHDYLSARRVSRQDVSISQSRRRRKKNELPKSPDFLATRKVEAYLLGLPSTDIIDLSVVLVEPSLSVDGVRDCLAQFS
jgi:hypothetical protein